MDHDQLSSDLASLKINRDARPARGGLKVIVWLVVIGVLIGAALLVGYPYLSSRIFRAEVSITEVGLVSPAQGSVKLTASGYVIAEDKAKVGAKAIGRIADLKVKEGSVLKKGDLIAQLDAVDQESQIATAKAKAAAARARVQTARATLAETQLQEQREKVLAEKGVSPKATYDDLVAKDRSLTEQVRAAEAEARSAEAEVTALEVLLADMKITAPIDGTVVTKNVEIGDVVGPQTGALVELADFGSLVAEIDVPENKLGQISLDRPAEILLDAFPDGRWRGAIIWIGRKVDRAKGSVKVRVKFVDPAEKVIPDMAARVNFLAKELDAASMKEPPKVVIPASAVIDREGGKATWVLSENQVKLRVIALGDKLGEGYVVKGGIDPGTKVIANPPSDLRDGQNIKEKRD